MAITSCLTDVAKSIAPNCNNPIVGGYTGRALLVPVSDANVTYTQLASNPRQITAITTAQSSTPFIGIENYYITPFENTAKQSNGDNGTIEFTKTVSFHIPLRGANTSKDIVEPLVKNALGFVAILEKKDKCGNGSFEVVGFQNGLKVNADGIAQSEATSNGDIVVTMSTSESWYEVAYCKQTTGETPADDYALTFAEFDALYKQKTMA